LLVVEVICQHSVTFKCPRIDISTKYDDQPLVEQNTFLQYSPWIIDTRCFVVFEND